MSAWHRSIIVCFFERPRFLATAILCGLSWLAAVAPMQAAPTDRLAAPKHVLLLHQAGRPGPFRGKFDVAFAQAMRSDDSHPMDVYEEAIDARRFPGVDQSRLVKEYLRNKFAGRTI